MKTLSITILFICLILLLITSCSEKKGSTVKQEADLRDALSYLSNVSSVAWYGIDGNDVYVGFWHLSDDWKMIIKGVALKGSKIIAAGCSVYATDADKEAWKAWKDWKPKSGQISISEVNSPEDLKAWLANSRPDIDIYDGVYALHGKIIQ